MVSDSSTLIYTSGYSKTLALFSLSGSELVLQENVLFGDNMTFVQVFSKVQSIFTFNFRARFMFQYDSDLKKLFSVHEVSQTTGLGNVGAISIWNFHNEEGENPNFEKIQVSQEIV